MGQHQLVSLRIVAEIDQLLQALRLRCFAVRLSARFSAPQLIFGLLVSLLAMDPKTTFAQSIIDIADSGTSEGKVEPNIIDVDSSQISQVYEQWVSEIEAIIARLRALTDDADQVAAGAQDDLAAPRDALTAIGSPPAAGEPPEADIIAEQRYQHQSVLAGLQAELTLVRLIKARIEATTGMIASYGHDRLAVWIVAKDDLITFLSERPNANDAATLFRDLRPSRNQLRGTMLGNWFPVMAGLIALAAAVQVERRAADIDAAPVK